MGNKKAERDIRSEEIQEIAGDYLEGKKRL